MTAVTCPDQTRAQAWGKASGKAAGTIHGRFQGLYGGRTPLPTELASTPDEHLRAVGLSRQKSAYLKDLGARVASGQLPIETLHELTDEEVVSALTQVKGIGRWTAQMFLMFRLGRPDVLPDLDLGVQKGRALDIANADVDASPCTSLAQEPHVPQRFVVAERVEQGARGQRGTQLRGLATAGDHRRENC